MAQYRFKKGCELIKICIKRRAYVLCECTESELEYLYELGHKDYILKSEPKKEESKKVKEEESPKDGE
jgi:hypothetical protein